MSLPGDQVSVKVVPRTRALVPLKGLESKIKYVAGKSRFTYEQILAYIQGIMNETLELTIKEVEVWIDEFVPKRSGDLRESLKKFLNKSKPPPTTVGELRNVRLILGAGADVKYAKYVIEMTDAMVQHEATWFEHSGKRAYSKGERVLLDDPNARGKFFEMMGPYGIERLRMNLTKIKWVRMKSA